MPMYILLAGVYSFSEVKQKQEQAPLSILKAILHLGHSKLFLFFTETFLFFRFLAWKKIFEETRSLRELETKTDFTRKVTSFLFRCRCDGKNELRWKKVNCVVLIFGLVRSFPLRVEHFEESSCRSVCVYERVCVGVSVRVCLCLCRMRKREGVSE